MAHKKKGEASAMTLRQQAYNHLNEMLEAGIGRSRHQDKTDGSDRDRIYSFKSFDTYRQSVEYYIRWLEINHPEIKTMKKARKYTRDWLTSLEGKYSAYTIQTRAKAICKYYGITPVDNDYYQPPVRHREDITRSRQRTKTDDHLSELKNEQLIHFCEHTGLRREGIEGITGGCLYSIDFLRSEAERIHNKSKYERDEKEVVLLDCYDRIALFRDDFHYYILVCEKGGKWRLAPILGTDSDVDRVVSKIESTARGHRVWGKVSKNCDIHSHRGKYAALLYRMYARPIDEIPYDKVNKGSGNKYQSEVYICRTDQAGKRFDKRAMLVVEKALGHESLHTFASHYAYLL